MTYVVKLEADLGGPETVTVGGLGLEWDYTENCAPMWRAAGADLAAFDGRPVWECLPLLRLAIGNMRSNPATYRAMDPPNAWGSYDGVLPMLERLLEAFEAAPKAIVRVHR